MLEARELFDLDLHARAAVFTDGAALSMRAAAPALDIVRWAWRAAGVPSIVVPRWSGDAAATTVFLEDFYQQMKEEPRSRRAAARARDRAGERGDESAVLLGRLDGCRHAGEQRRRRRRRNATGGQKRRLRGSNLRKIRNPVTPWLLSPCPPSDSVHPRTETVREEVTPADDFDRILGRADQRNRIQD